MGHLINAKAMRVGWEQDWCDLWFSKNHYYCEFLYSCFRIRYFLIFTYFNKATDRFGMIYSHFYIFIGYKLLSVYLFLYDSRMEIAFDNFIIRYYNYYQNFLGEENDEVNLMWDEFIENICVIIIEI